ncbi:F-box-like protein [Rhizoctonia solani AG-3 Rhs1AP]|uniref:F-box-like protein n=1 Tax=Rhizoctonia solani AG-3 Rhs1AP TaxID=1086054 RepID=X8JLT8_9AGAM|nr:F-box-like protein [Rhizoctonia solani AG-3 Rhs1AP]
MSALDIPELLTAVLGHLNQSSLARCAQVCGAWRAPATELLWAQVQDLEKLVNTSFSKNILGCFKSPSWNRLLHMPYPELASPPSSPHIEDQPDPARDTLAQAWSHFRSLDIDWTAETKTFRMRTQHVTQIRLTQSSVPALLVLHILQETYPTALQGIFPRLFALTIGNDHYAPLISQCITKLPSLRHVTYEASSMSLYSAHVSSWRIACEAALGLTSFRIQFTSDPDNKEYFGQFLDPYWASPGAVFPSLSRFPFVLTRPWKHIELPGRLVGKRLFSALASIDTLETLTIYGSPKSPVGIVKHEGIPFRSLRELRLLDVSTTGEEYFTGVILQGVQSLELQYLPGREKITGRAAPPNLAVIAQACPNASSVIVTVNNNAEGEQFVRLLNDSDFEPLLAIDSLEKLVVRVPSKSSVCLSDDFLDRAARSWPCLRELDMDPAHSSQTLASLQGLAPLARRCPKLRSLQLGIQPNHIHTVFNAELYAQGDEPSIECPLVYLNIGCPPVYSSEALADFLLTIFPKLRQVECPKSVNSIPCSRGDYFVWSQVVRTVQERDRDLDNLARTLRARDLAEKHELVGGDFIVSSIDDSDEDYWAYSGSEDESYSSDED